MRRRTKIIITCAVIYAIWSLIAFALWHSSNSSDSNNYNPCSNPYAHGIQIGETNGYYHTFNCP